MAPILVRRFYESSKNERSLLIFLEWEPPGSADCVIRRKRLSNCLIASFAHKQMMQLIKNWLSIKKRLQISVANLKSRLHWEDDRWFNETSLRVAYFPLTSWGLEPKGGQLITVDDQ